ADPVHLREHVVVGEAQIQRDRHRQQRENEKDEHCGRDEHIPSERLPALGVVAFSLPRSRGRCLRLGRARRRGALDDYCHCPYRRMARAMFRAASSSACFELFFWYTASSTAFCMIVWYTSS